MKQWLKEFFCNHDYEVHYLEIHRATFKCSKCGKIKSIKV